MPPPLRTRRDVDALVEGLADGTIDCIATDHAPHATSEKEGEYDHAAFGIVGLETAASLVLDRLVRPGLIDLRTAVARMSTDPARLLHLPGGSRAVGAPADGTLLDRKRELTVDPAGVLYVSGNAHWGGLRPRG